jgi:hypothetical protein
MTRSTTHRPLVSRISAALGGGKSLSARDIAAACGTNTCAVKATVANYPETFTRSGFGPSARVALAG